MKNGVPLSVLPAEGAFNRSAKLYSTESSGWWSSKFSLTKNPFVATAGKRNTPISQSFLASLSKPMSFRVPNQSNSNRNFLRHRTFALLKNVVHGDFGKILHYPGRWLCDLVYPYHTGLQNTAAHMSFWCTRYKLLTKTGACSWPRRESLWTCCHQIFDEPQVTPLMSIGRFLVTFKCHLF